MPIRILNFTGKAFPESFKVKHGIIDFDELLPKTWQDAYERSLSPKVREKDNISADWAEEYLSEIMKNYPCHELNHDSRWVLDYTRKIANIAKRTIPHWDAEIRGILIDGPGYFVMNLSEQLSRLDFRVFQPMLYADDIIGITMPVEKPEKPKHNNIFSPEMAAGNWSS